MPGGRRLDQLQHGEFGFSRRHDWIAHEGRWACERCFKVVDDWSLVPDDCHPHDEAALQSNAEVGHAITKRHARRS